MTGFLLDTSVISELVRKKPEKKVIDWVSATDESLMYLSVLTIGEIRKGIALHPDAARRTKLEGWLGRDLMLRFADRVLSIDQNVADRWGRIMALVRDPLPVIDSLLAATALQHNLTLVTRNADDVARTAVPVFNPWES